MSRLLLMLLGYFIPANPYILQINPTRDDYGELSPVQPDSPFVDAIDVFHILLYFTDKSYRDNDGESSPIQPDSSGVVVTSYCNTGNFCSEHI